MQAHLVAYEYGAGAAWGYVLADTVEEIEDLLPEVDVHIVPPLWMSMDDIHRLREHVTVELTGDDCLDRILEGNKRLSMALAS